MQIRLRANRKCCVEYERPLRENAVQHREMELKVSYGPDSLLRPAIQCWVAK